MNGDFDLIACDFSLRCSGIARLHYQAADRTVTIVEKCHIPIREKTPIGKALSRISDVLASFLAANEVQIAVREKVFAGHFADSDRLFRTAGVADMTLWQLKQQSFYDVAATSIKKEITGNGRAEKSAVAAALDYFVGVQEYKTDDESDAVAAGIAFLIREGYIHANHTGSLDG